MAYAARVRSGLYRHGLYRHGLYRHGLYRHGVHRHGLYRHGLYRHGLYRTRAAYATACTARGPRTPRPVPHAGRVRHGVTAL